MVILGKSVLRATISSGERGDSAAGSSEKSGKTEQPPGFEVYRDARILEKWVVGVTLALKGGVQMLQTRRKVVVDWQPGPIWDG